MKKKIVGNATLNVAKKSLSVILSLCMLISITAGFDLTAKAEELSGSCGDNLNWTLDTESGELVISGTGNMTDYTYSSYPWYKNSSYIKTVTINRGVTDVGKNAFYRYSYLTNVSIPDTVTNIGNAAFFECTSMISIDVDAANEYYTSQDGVLFNKDKTELLQYPLGNPRTDYTIPDSVEEIKSYAFYYSKNLVTLTIPDSVTSIGTFAFKQCQKLTDVILGNNVKTIDNYAFSFCYNLKSITIPDSVTSLGVQIFEQCKKLESVKFGSGLSTINTSAFLYCTSLTNLTIPSNITRIGTEAFSNCSKLSTVVLNDGVQTVGSCAFNECTSLSKIIIPDSVTKVENAAFYYCKKLTDVYYSGSEDDWNNITISTNNEYLTNATIHYLTDGLSSINFEYAVKDDSTIEIAHYIGNDKVVSIPDEIDGVKVTSIGGGCASDFMNKKVEVLNIPASITSINSTIWGKANYLTEINVDENNLIYSSTNGVLYSKDKTILYKYPSQKTDVSFTIPNTVNKVNRFAFDECVNLEEINISENTTDLFDKGSGDTLCYYASALKKINVADGNPDFTSIDGVLYNKDLTKLYIYPAGRTNSDFTINKKVSSLYFYAFANCSNLRNLYILNDGIHFAEDSFKGCTGIENIYFAGTEEYWNALPYFSNNAVIYNANVIFNYSADCQHQWNNGTIEKASTCTEKGTRNFVCLLCGEKRTEEIDCAPHNYNAVVTASTCISQGFTTYTCSICKNTYTADYTQTASHNFGNNEKACLACGALNYDYVAPKTSPAGSAKINGEWVASSQKNTKLKKLTKSKKSFKIQWSKVSTVTGYQVQYATDKKFKKNKKTTTINKNKTTTATVKKLKSNKKYYVRIRTYKNVRFNGKTVKVYSKWSPTKTVTTK